MHMAKECDTGDMILVKTQDIHPDETAEDLFKELAVLGADAIAEAIDKAGIDITADGADIADDLAKAMRKIKIEGLTGELTWNDEGQVEKPATAYVIQDGKYIAA